MVMMLVFLNLEKVAFRSGLLVANLKNCLWLIKAERNLLAGSWQGWRWGIAHRITRKAEGLDS
jgi:hypothetical protein